MTREREKGMGEEPNNKTQESLVVYKSFNTLRRKLSLLTTDSAALTVAAFSS
jgi:hypothetical protein